MKITPDGTEPRILRVYGHKSARHEASRTIVLRDFRDGKAIATVDEMYYRRDWDGNVILMAYLPALRQAIDRDEVTKEIDFDDYGRYYFLTYTVTLNENSQIQDAAAFVNAVVERVEERAYQLVHRHRDGLTGLFDRASFENDLTYSLRGGQRIALVMVDIDHFKNVNDTLGHRVGDEVLRKVAKVILDQCGGKHQAAYRYGGEELALILTGDNARRSVELSETIRATVERLRFDAYDLTVTVSVGVAAGEGDCDNDSLVKKADARLYQAKQAGRNRVHAA